MLRKKKIRPLAGTDAHARACTHTHTHQCPVPMALRTPNPPLGFLKLPPLPQNCLSCPRKTGSYQSVSDWRTVATFGLPIVFLSFPLSSLPFSKISRKSHPHSNTRLLWHGSSTLLSLGCSLGLLLAFIGNWRLWSMEEVRGPAPSGVSRNSHRSLIFPIPPAPASPPHQQQLNLSRHFACPHPQSGPLSNLKALAVSIWVCIFGNGLFDKGGTQIPRASHGRFSKVAVEKWAFGEKVPPATPEPSRTLSTFWAPASP